MNTALFNPSNLPADLQWLHALAKNKHEVQRHAAQTIICRLAESEANVNKLRRCVERLLETEVES